MMSTVQPAYQDNEIHIQDHVYIRHGERELALRLHRPPAAEPVPVVVNLHGGAWNRGSLAECGPRDIAVARTGVACAALDFRQAEDGYPSSLQDIHFAIRWLRAHAGDLGLDATRVGIAGQSSGGHLAMLLAMRPDDARFGAIDEGLAGTDASVSCVAMNWPVINPLSRYRYAKRLRASDESHPWTATIPEQHDTYWRTEAAMEEGNPMLMLERGESVLTPPALWVQGRPDPVHDYRDIESPLDANEPERFATRYADAGGKLEVAYIGQANRAEECLEPMAAFLARELLPR